MTASATPACEDQVGRSLEPVYGFRSLLAFKAKFQPEFRPLFMTYPDAAALPSIAAAVRRAYLPEVRPRQLGRLARQLAARRPRDRARRGPGTPSAARTR